MNVNMRYHSFLKYYWESTVFIIHAFIYSTNNKDWGYAGKKDKLPALMEITVCGGDWSL